ncbi:MAG TPA: FAD-dependent oxidoreductase [Candidatus Saccharimonadales bacterium]|nr:FAD-dependent oxidoreductase [Candidatus Saccharimonadales bacterium]
MKVIFDRLEPLTSSINTFWFKPNKPVDYQAGQFTEIKLPHNHVDDRGDKRWFTISASPTDHLISITTKFSEPSSSFKQQLIKLLPGTPLHLADPMGDFVLPKDKSIPLVFVAGGMGITPMHSMVKFLTDQKLKRKIQLIYATQTPTDQLWLNLFEAYCSKVTLLSRQEDGDKANLTADQILQLTKPTDSSRIYLSGPEPMIENLVEQFDKLKIDSNRLVTDYFPGYLPI